MSEIDGKPVRESYAEQIAMRQRRWVQQRAARIEAARQAERKAADAVADLFNRNFKIDAHGYSEVIKWLAARAALAAAESEHP